MTLAIRPATDADRDVIWSILEPVIRAGETYPLPTDWDRDTALAYWLSDRHTVFVATDEDDVLGTYYLRANNLGGGDHIANCGYMTSQSAQGRGIARAMCTHSIEQATRQGYAAMQFNFVIASNTRAVALWTSFGFETLCRLPAVFDHPQEGFVDALVMFKELD